MSPERDCHKVSSVIIIAYLSLFSGSHYKPRGVIQVQRTSCGNLYSNPECIFGNWENVSIPW